MHLLATAAVALALWLGYPQPQDLSVYTLVQNLLLVHAWGLVNFFSWNAPSWTISVEMFCYLWFPFAAMMLFRAPHWVSAIVLVASVYVVKNDTYLTILYYLGFDLTGIDVRLGRYLALFGAMFLSGMATFRLTQGIEGQPSWVSDVLVLTGLGVILYASFQPEAHWPLLIAACLLVAGLKRGTGVGGLLFGNRVSVFLGEISYALYLVHVVLNVFIANNDPMTPLWAKLETAIVIAALIHFCYDLPLRRWLRSKITGQRKSTHRTEVQLAE